METIINGVKYKYVSNIFGVKILTYVDFGDGNWVNSGEYNFDKEMTEEEFIKTCEEIEAQFN